MRRPPRGNKALLLPRTVSLLAAGVAMAVVALFATGALGTGPAASSANPASSVRVLTPSLSVSPSTAVPNQSIAVTGTGFTATTTSPGAGPNGVHQITGTGISFIRVAGLLLGPPHAVYPINLDSSGSLVTSVVIPVTFSSLIASTQTVEVTDDRGVTASATFTVPSRTFTLDPTTSRRGSTVTAKGTGFPARNQRIPGTFSVSLDYAGTSLTVVNPDSSGAFETTFEVPRNAVIPSTNTVTASIIEKPGIAITTHSIPRASIVVIPAISSAGATITVTGSDFPAFVPVTSVTIGGVQALSSTAASSDAQGAFNVTALVAVFPLGDHPVWATAGGITAVGKVNITTPTPTPLPTPTPTPTPPASTTALQPLLSDFNLLRVWNFNNITKEWTFFDARSPFSSSNTITDMIPGAVYWISLISDQTVTLNSKERVLLGGWNLLAW